MMSLLTQPLGGAERTTVRIARVFPDQICYRPGATARFEIQVVNPSETTASVRLVCEIERELDERQIIFDQAVRIPAGRERNVAAIWKTRTTDQWGFDIIATVLDSQGHVLDRKSDSFAVTTRNWKVGGGVSQWTVVYEPLSPDELKRRREATVPEKYRAFPAFLLTGEETAARMRKTYATHLEWYSWEPSGFNSRTPKDEEWLSGQGLYYVKKRTLRDVTRALQRQGIQVWTHQHTPITGIDGMEFLRAHPEWIAYDEWGGGITADVENLTAWREGRPFPHSSGGPLWGTAVLMVPETVDFAADQVIASTKMFGWDGFRSDGLPHVLPDTYWEAGQIGIGPQGYRDGFRYDGTLEKVSTQGKDPARVKREVDQRSLDLWLRFSGRIRKSLPDFQFAVNLLGYPEPGFFDQTFPSLCRDGYILDENVKSIETPGHDHQVWTNFQRRVRSLAEHVRKHGSLTQVVIFIPDGPQIIPARHHASAIIRASQCHPLYLPGPPSHARFALRYSALIAAHDVHKVREGVEQIVAVSGERGVWWKDFVYRRDLADGAEQRIIHLLNEPTKPSYDPDLPAPPSQRVKVSLSIPPGKGLEKILYLDADRLETARLEPVKINGRAEVTVPKLDYWGVIVAQWKPN
jgi:hypothetical protein